MALKAQQVHRDRQVMTEHKAFKVQQVMMVQLGQPAHKVHRVILAFKVQSD
jgi:hypothetical protein